MARLPIIPGATYRTAACTKQTVTSKRGGCWRLRGSHAPPSKATPCPCCAPPRASQKAETCDAVGTWRPVKQSSAHHGAPIASRPTEHLPAPATTAALGNLHQQLASSSSTHVRTCPEGMRVHHHVKDSVHGWAQGKSSAMAGHECIWGLPQARALGCNNAVLGPVGAGGPMEPPPPPHNQAKRAVP